MVNVLIESIDCSVMICQSIYMIKLKLESIMISWTLCRGEKKRRKRLSYSNICVILYCSHLSKSHLHQRLLSEEKKKTFAKKTIIE